MKIQNIREKLKLSFVVAFTLAFLAFSNAELLFAAAPTVTTDAASSVTKTTATLNGSITNTGNLDVTVAGFDYGTTSSYGSSTSGGPFYEEALSFGLGALVMPTKIVVDSVGSIYVADQNTIMKFSSLGVLQTTIGSGGTSEGEFQNAYSVTRDSGDNIYVLDKDNHRVQKFNSAGVFVLMFGFGVDTGAPSFEICTSGCGVGQSGGGDGQLTNGTTDIAYNFNTDEIFVLDASNSRISIFDTTGAYLYKFGTPGTGGGEFWFPTAVDFDSSGNIYVTDTTPSGRLEKFNASYSYVDSLALGGTPVDIAIDSADNIYVASNSLSYFYTIDPAMTTTTGFNVVGTAIQGIAVDGGNSIFIADLGGAVAYKFEETEIRSSLTGLSCGTTYHYRAFATNADGTSYGSDATFTTSACEVPTVSTDAYTNIKKTTATLHGTHLTDGVAPSALRGFEYGETTGYGTTVTSAGSLSILQFGYQDVVEGAFESPYGVALDASGNIYVSDTGNNRIQEFDPDGNFLNMIGWGVAGGIGLETCTTGCTAGTSGSGDGELNAPRGISIDAGGNINIADYGNNRVQKFDPTGIFQAKFGTLGSGVANLSGPSDVGLVFNTTNPAFLDTGNNRIRPCATYTGCPASDIGTAVLNAPEAMDRAGLFVADTGDSQVHKFGSLGQTVSVSLSYATSIGGLSGPKGISSENNGADVYVSDTGNDRILKFVSTDPTAVNLAAVTLKFVSQFGTSGSASGQFSSPSHITTNSSGEIFVADTGNHRIQKLSPFFYEDITGLNCGTTYHYRAFATNTDGTGYGSDQTFSTASCGSITSGGGGGPDYGCTDPSANNYDASAEIDDFSCDYTGVPTGCIDPDATNFNSSAVLSDGSCIYPAGYYGCMDPGANNYSATALVDDGSCTYPPGTIAGCMDSTATNYNSLATVSDNSCEYDETGGPTDIFGCTDTFADNYNPNATVDDGFSCEYSIDPVYGCIDSQALNYNVNATTNDGSCTYEPPPWFPPPVIEVVSTINEVIREVTGWTPEEQGNVYKDVAVAGLVVPSIFMLLAERSAIASVILRLWNIIPTLLGFRRKRRPWGTVYDSVTKQPLDPVYVTLRDMFGAEVSTSITDLDGRYGFITEMGEYTINAKKTDYVFPSVKMKGDAKDELYDNLYFGENIKVTDETEIINKNIPMDALKFNWNEFAKTKNRKLMKFYSKTELFMARIAKIIFIAGFVASFLLIFLEPTTWNYIILSVYVTIFILSFIGVRPRKPGFIIERSTGYPMSFAIITVFSALLGQEVAHTIVGKTGKYHILVPKGKYYMKLQKKTGEQTYEEIYTSEVFKSTKGYIDKVIKV